MNTKRLKGFRKKQLSAWIASLSLGLQPLMGLADIHVDPLVENGKKAQLDVAPNGVPVINITAPSQQGVSHNVFTEYNVGNEGLILNNSAGIVESQLGGLIAGNAQLGSTSARLIVNEVTGTHSSSLMGVTEVAGQAADFVLANPNGISCDGCGFINIPRATLATGTPLIENGRLRSIEIAGGQFDLQGRGMNAANVGSLEILTRVANINAQFIADRLKIISGAHTFNYEEQTYQALDEDNAPLVSLDVSTLGGMYANSIALVGTEAGVGVRVDTSMSAYGDDLVINANGDIVARELSANDVLHIYSENGDVRLEENLNARQVNIQAGGHFENNGDQLLASNAININAATFTNNGSVLAGVPAPENNQASLVVRTSDTLINNGLLYSRGSAVFIAGDIVNSPLGQIDSAENLRLTANNLENYHAQISGTADMQINIANQLNNNEGVLISRGGDLAIVTDELDNESGIIHAAGELSINVASMLNNAAGDIYAEDALEISGEGSLANNGGRIDVGEDGEQNLDVSGGLDNSENSWISGEFNLILDVARLDNRGGQILHEGEGEFLLNVDEVIDNTDGLIHSEGFSRFSTTTLLNDNGQISSVAGLELNVSELLSSTRGVLYTEGMLDITTANFDNTEGSAVGDAGLRLNISERLTNTQGLLQSEQWVQAEIQDFSNAEGELSIEGDAGSVSLNVGQLENQNGLLSGGELNLQTAQLNNENARIVAASSLDITTDSLNNNDGWIESAATLTVNGRSSGSELLNNSGVLLAQDSITLNINSINNNDGDILSNTQLNIETITLQNQRGWLEASDIEINAAVLANNSGVVIAGNNLNANLTSLDNASGQVFAQAQMDLSAQTFINSNGRVEAELLTILGENLDNFEGILLADADINANITQLNNHSGQIIAQANLIIESDNVSNQAGRLEGENLLFAGSTLDNQQGLIFSRADANLAFTSIDNTQGQIYAADALALQANVFNNRLGRMEANTLSVEGGSLSNSEGAMLASTVLQMELDSLANNHGLIVAPSQITVLANTVDNQQGILESNQIFLQADDFDNTQGLVYAYDLLNANLSSLANEEGRVLAGNSILAQIEYVDNQRGSIESDSLTLDANALTNSSGVIFVDSNVDANIISLNNNQGQLIARASLNLVAENIVNTEGWFESDVISIVANDLDNSQGAVLASESLSLSLTGNLNNSQGNIDSGSQLDIRAQNLINTNGIVIAAGTEASQIQVANALSNESGEIASNADNFFVSAATLDNSEGRMSHAGNVLLLDIDDLLNASGAIEAQNRAEIRSNTLNNNQGLLWADSLLISAVSVENTSGLIQIENDRSQIQADAFNNENGLLLYLGSDELVLSGSGELFNTAGLLQSNGVLTLDYNSLNNAGGELSILGVEASTLNVSAVNNASGLILSNASQLDINTNAFLNVNGQIEQSGSGALNLYADEVDNTNAYLVANTVFIDAASVNNFQGVIAADVLALEVGAMNNNAGLLRAYSRETSALTVDADTSINNLFGEVNSNGGLNISALSVDNTEGQLLAMENMGLVLGGDLLNNRGLIDANQALNLVAENLLNVEGQISQYGAAESRIAIDASIDNTDGNITSNAQNFSLTASSLINTSLSLPGSGLIHHAGNGDFVVNVNDLDNGLGELASLGNINLTSESIDNSGGNVFSENLTINADNLVNDLGLIEAGSVDITLRGDLHNGLSLEEDEALPEVLVDIQRGIRATADDGSLRISANNIQNNFSSILAAGTLADIQAQDFVNQGGILRQTGDAELSLDFSGLLVNRAGLIDSDSNLTLNANNVTNSENAMLSSSGLMSLILLGDFQNDAWIDSASAILMSAANLENTGNLLAEGRESDASLSTFDIRSVFNNQNGALAVGSDTLQINAEEVNNSSLDHGIQHFGRGSLDLNAARFDNSNGSIASAAALQITADNLDNSNGRLSAEATQINAQTLENNFGVLQGDTRLNINVTNNLNNRTGFVLTLTSSEINALDVFIGGELDNSAYGVIQSAGLGGRVQAASINNATLISTPDVAGSRIVHRGEGTFTLDVSGALINTAGTIESNENLRVNVASIDNQTGWLEGRTSLYLASQTDINNQDGVLSSHGEMTIDALNGDILNNAGFIQHFGTGTVTLRSNNDLLNRGGSVYIEASDFNIDVDNNIDNLGGLIGHSGSGNFTINALNLLNYADADSDVAAEGEANTRVVSNGTLNLVNLNSVSNVGFNATNEGRAVINAANIAVSGTTDLDNRFGAFSLNDSEAVSTVDLSNINNQNGQISTRGTTTLNFNSLNNTDGSLSSEGDLILNLPSFSLDDGLLSAAMNLTVNTEGDLINNFGNEILAGSNITLNTTGDIRNFGVLSTLGSLRLAGEEFENGSAARLAADGDLSLSFSGDVINEGLLLSTGNMDVTAANLSNYDTFFSLENMHLFITGDILNTAGSELYANNHLLITANEDLDHSAALHNISGRITAFTGNLDLYVDDIENTRELVEVEVRRLIAFEEEYLGSTGGSGAYVEQFHEISSFLDIVTASTAPAVMSAGGNLYIETNAIVNDASVIAAAGNIDMVGGTLENTGVGLNSYYQVLFRSDVYSTLDGSTCEPDADMAPCIVSWTTVTPGDPVLETDLSLGGLIIAGENNSQTFVSANNILGENELSGDPNAGDEITRSDESADVDGTPFTFETAYEGAYSAPVFEPRPDATIDTETEVEIQNSSTENDEISANSLAVYSADTLENSDSSLLQADVFSRESSELSAAERPERLNQAEVAESERESTDTSTTPPAESDLATTNPENENNPQGQSQLGDERASDAPPLQEFDETLADTPPANLPEIVVIDPTDNITIPDSSLFDIDESDDADYYVQLGEAIRDYNEFISSDYFLTRLNIHPDDVLKRLGDGFYESRLVTDAIFAARGLRFLTDHTTGEQIANDQAQYEYLMANGVAAAESLQLSYGVALTPEQVARLTHDIVWMEEKEVNGQRVVAPVYYATSASADAFNHGSVIGGTNVSIYAENGFNNTGTVAGTHTVSIESLQDVRNGGVIRANNGVHIEATSIVNEQHRGSGGLIESENGLVQLIATQGNIDNLRNAEISANILTMQASEGSITNQAGTLRGRGRVVALARDDINNLSDMDRAAIIEGGDVFLTSEQGNVNNRAAEREWETQSGQYRRTGVAALIQADNDISIDAAQDVNVRASSLLAGNNINVEAGRDIVIESATNEVHTASEGRHWAQRTDLVRNVSSEMITGGDTSLHAGRDTNIVGSNISSDGSISIHSERDTNISVVNDVESRYSYYRQDDSFGRSESDTSEHHAETVTGAVIQAGENIAINARGTTAGVLTLDSGNVNIAGAILSAGNNLVVAAEDDINVSGTHTVESHMESHQSSGTFGLSGTDVGARDLTVNLNAATIEAGGNVHMQSGNNIHLSGTDLSAEENVTLQAVDNITLSAGEVLMQSESWHNESGVFTNDAVFSETESSEGDMLALARASSIEAGGNLHIDAGSATVIGSHLHGEDSVTVETDLGDIEFLAARTSVETWSKDKEVNVGFGDIVENLSRPDEWVEVENGRATMTFANATYDEVDEQSQSTQVEGSTITTGENGQVALLSGGEIFGEGLLLGTRDENGDISEQAPDVTMFARDDISIVDATETYQSRTEETHGSAEMSVVVQHQAAEVAMAAEALKESTEALDQARKDYKNYRNDLDSMDKQLAAMEADLAAGVPGISPTDVIEMREIIDDMEGDEAWYLTGIAMATADVTSKTTQLVQQTGAAANSVGTWGFNAGLQLDISAEKTETSVSQTTSVGSHINANTLTMMTGMERVEDEDGNTHWQQNQDLVGDTAINIRGSDLNVTDTFSFDTGDFIVDAGKNTLETSNNTEQINMSAQVTVYGAAGGASINGNYNRSDNTEKEISYTNSQITANVINMETEGDVIIRGGNVHAERELNADIGGDLWLESVQNRSRSRSLSEGISGGVSFGAASENENSQADNANDLLKRAKCKNCKGVDDVGSVSGVNAGVNYSSGMSTSRETVRSSLTSGGEANLSVSGDTTIVAATLATMDQDGNDLGLLNLETETLHYTNLREFSQNSQTTTALSTNVGPEQQDPNPTNTAEDNDGDNLLINSSSLNYANNSHYSAGNSLATLGEGTITIRDEENSDDLGGINRDVGHDTYALWDVERQEGNIDLTLDHRLLSREGLEEIRDDLNSALEGARDLKDFTVDLFVDHEYSAEELEQSGFGPPVPFGQQAYTGYPTEEDIKEAEQITDLIRQLEQQQGEDGEGEIGWEAVYQVAWDFENGGPDVALQALNDAVYSQDLNGLDNIRDLREQVNHFNERQALFDDTVGFASYISTMGGGVIRMGITAGESLSPATVAARDTIDDAARWTDNSGATSRSSSNDVVEVGSARGGQEINASATNIRSNSLDGAGGSYSGPPKIEYDPSGSVVSQGNSPVCGPACCCMAIRDNTGRSVDLNTIVNQFDEVRITGVNVDEMSAVLNQNGVRNTVNYNSTPLDLRTTLNEGHTAIVGVRAGDGNHFIIVDGVRTVDGVPYYLTRDPFIGPRGVRADILDDAINGNTIIVGE